MKRIPVLAVFVLSCLLTSFGSRKGDVRFQGIDSFPFLSTLTQFRGQMQTAIAGPVQLRSGLHNDFYVAGSAENGFLCLAASLAPGTRNTRRIPLNLSIVIDRSSSMAGTKIKQVKEAAKQLIGRLQAEDRISIVAYDQEVTLVQASVRVTQPALIQRKIDSLKEQGATNLWGGTEKGIEQVRSFYRPDHINKVLLLSDGQATAGLTNSRIICTKVQAIKDREGITVSTFGVGLDYNEVLLQDLAVAGAGNYYRITDPEQMTAVLEKELDSYTKLVAQDAVLQVALPAGIQVQQLYGQAGVVKGQTLTFYLRELYAGDTKAALLKYRLKPGSSQSPSFAVQLRYTLSGKGVADSLRTTHLLQVVAAEGERLQSYNKEVLQESLLYQSDAVLEIALSEADKGLFEGARQRLRKNEQYLAEHYMLVDSAKDLRTLQVLNQNYRDALKDAEHLPADSFKLLQKKVRQQSYQLRMKRQP